MKRILLCLLALLAASQHRLQAEDVFREGDVLEMRLSGPSEEFTREFNLVIVVDEGSVRLPLIGRVSAVGMSSTQLASVIESRLKEGKVFTGKVNITVNPLRNRQTILIRGSVRAPGRQVWIPDLTLTGAISAAGGPAWSPSHYEDHPQWRGGDPLVESDQKEPRSRPEAPAGRHH